MNRTVVAAGLLIVMLVILIAALALPSTVRAPTVLTPVLTRSAP